VEGATQILAQAGLPVKEFAMEISNAQPEGLYDFNKHRDMLAREVHQGNVHILGLYSNPTRDHDLVMDWQGLAYVDLGKGSYFLGLPESVEPRPKTLLRVAYELAKNVTDTPYGIAYSHEYRKGPDFYAVGIIASPDPEVFSDAAALEAGDRVARWFHELNGARRYLNGWFRGAYPASVLSEGHVNADLKGGKTIRSAGIGNLTALDATHWLWELAAEEISVAEKALREAGRLLC
jgi:hypothetical protein